jgi:hypothetical protein
MVNSDRSATARWGTHNVVSDADRLDAVEENLAEEMPILIPELGEEFSTFPASLTANRH